MFFVFVVVSAPFFSCTISTSQKMHRTFASGGEDRDSIASIGWDRNNIIDGEDGME